VPVAISGVFLWDAQARVEDNLIVAGFFLLLQLTLLLVLKARRIRDAALFGAAIALALHVLFAHLVIWLPPRSGQWWWVYVLTFPGAVVGSGLLAVYGVRSREVRAALDVVISCGLLLGAVLVNAAICLAI
jgi:hypothetical protein